MGLVMTREAQHLFRSQTDLVLAPFLRGRHSHRPEAGLRLGR